MNRKAVAPIISVILLLLMVMAMAGAVFLWLRSTVHQVMEKTSSTTDMTLSSLLLSLQIQAYSLDCTDGNVSNISLIIYNRGSDSVSLNAIVIDEKIVDGGHVTPAYGTALDSNVAKEFTIANWNETTGTNIYVNITNVTRRSVRFAIITDGGGNSFTRVIDGRRC